VSNARNGGSALSGAPYAVAKAGVSNLARYLAREWATDGLRVNCLAPGPVDTPMLDRLNPEQHAALQAAIPLGRYTSGREVAAAIAFLCSDHAASTTGATTNISGGLVLD
jgi:3-oxoacyl-[acyl-carrier protein] reductase